MARGWRSRKCSRPMRLEMNQSVRQEIPVICPAGSYGYVRGLPGEAGLHAAFHSRYMVAAQAGR